jgi:hypothetical protein
MQINYVRTQFFNARTIFTRDYCRTSEISRSTPVPPGDTTLKVLLKGLSSALGGLRFNKPRIHNLAKRGFIDPRCGSRGAPFATRITGVHESHTVILVRFDESVIHGVLIYL